MATGRNIVQVVALTFGVIMIWLSKPGSSLFSFHPALMVLGLMVFALEGILLMKDNRVPPKYKVTVHWIGEAVGVILSYLGAAAIYINKEQMGKPHYVTWHGIFGLITLILLTVQSFGGLPAKYAVTVSKYVPLKPKLIKQGHGLSGIVASTGIFLTVILSLYSTWFTTVTGESTVLWWLALGLILYPRLYLASLLVSKTSKA